MRLPLAVLLPEVGVLTETFLEWDVNQLWPGRTVAISDPPPNGATVKHRPTWTTAAPHLAFEPVADDPPPSAERCKRVAQFLTDHDVQVVIVEYLDFAERWLDLLIKLDVPVWVRGYGADISARLTERYRRFNALAGVIVPTRAAARRVASVGVNQQRTHIVPYPVAAPDTPPVRLPTEDVLRVVSIGRLVEKKGHHYLIEAFGQAVRQYPSLSLDIIGDGPLRTDLQTLIDDAGLTDRVRLRGGLPPAHVAQALKRADLFVHHAVTAHDGDVEAQPLAILEAMAAGLPVIATRHEGIPETITEQHNGQLVDERDTDGTAAALVALANDAEQRERIGQTAWRTVRARHSHQQVRAQLLGLLGLSAAEPTR